MRKTLIRVLLVFASLCLVVLSVYMWIRPSSALADAEQYKVLSDYLQSRLTGESHDLGDPNGLVVIAASSQLPVTVSGGGWLRRHLGFYLSLMVARRDLAVAPRLLFANFFVANLRSRTLERKFRISAKYELVAPGEIAAVGARFPESYGVVTFSRVGFDRDIREAIFYTDHLCGLCGDGGYVYMRKVGDHWKLVAGHGTWIS